MTPQEELDRAISKFLIDSEWYDGSYFSDKFIVVGMVSKVLPNADSGSGYYHILSHGQMPDHDALGLLHMGINLINGVGRFGRPDEED